MTRTHSVKGKLLRESASEKILYRFQGSKEREGSRGSERENRKLTPEKEKTERKSKDGREGKPESESKGRTEAERRKGSLKSEKSGSGEEPEEAKAEDGEGKRKGKEDRGETEQEEEREKRNRRTHLDNCTKNDSMIKASCKRSKDESQEKLVKTIGLRIKATKKSS